MLKRAFLSLAIFLTFVSASFAQTPPPGAMCFPVEVTINTAPAKERGRLEGDALAEFKQAIASRMEKGSSPVPADADLVILFKVNDKITGFAVVKAGCTLGTGTLPNKLINKLLGKGDDGSI